MMVIQSVYGDLVETAIFDSDLVTLQTLIEENGCKISDPAYLIMASEMVNYRRGEIELNKLKPFFPLAFLGGALCLTTALTTLGIRFIDGLEPRRAYEAATVFLFWAAYQLLKKGSKESMDHKQLLYNRYMNAVKIKSLITCLQ